jgi:hypothetical protein
MRWWPRRNPPARPAGASGSPDGRLVDGEVVRLPGRARWADLLGEAGGPAGEQGGLCGPTRVLPVLVAAPLLTPGQRWRGRGGGRR